jgi:hypothetical protein
MASTHPYIATLLQCIDLEEKEQVKRYSLDQQHTLKSLKAEGLALHPITVTKKNFGYADYPEVSFRLHFPPEASQFRDGAAIECFYTGEESVKGILLNLEGKVGEFRLFAPDFPDWIEESGVGIKQVWLRLKKILDNKRLVAEKTTSSYRQEFRNLFIALNSNPSHSEWMALYQTLCYCIVTFCKSTHLACFLLFFSAPN